LSWIDDTAGGERDEATVIRLRNAPLAFVALLASAGLVAAASTPEAANDGLAIATQHSGQSVPVVPDAPVGAPPAAPAGAGHGADVSAVATGTDPTPNTNRGADVSAVAKDNHGHATASQHTPTTAGKPTTTGKPSSVPPVTTPRVDPPKGAPFTPPGPPTSLPAGPPITPPGRP